MSYGFNMYFKHCTNEAEAYIVAAKYAKELEKPERIKEMIEENSLFFVPSYRMHLDRYDQSHIGRQMDEYWLRNLFSLHFVFWPEYNLLGLLGDTWPGVKDYFPKSVYFQNSCDQDYEEETWEDICPLFDSIMQEVSSQPVSREDFMDDDDDEDSEELTEERKAYYVRSKIYDTIYSTLKLDKWLYGHDDKSFTRFTMCAIHSMEQAMDINRMLQAKIRRTDKMWGKRDDMLVCVIVKRGNIETTNYYRYTFDAFEKPTPTLETFKEKAESAVRKYLETVEGKRISENLQTSAFQMIFPFVPNSILQEFNIKALDTPDDKYVMRLD